MDLIDRMRSFVGSGELVTESVNINSYVDISNMTKKMTSQVPIEKIEFALGTIMNKRFVFKSFKEFKRIVDITSQSFEADELWQDSLVVFDGVSFKNEKFYNTIADTKGVVFYFKNCVVRPQNLQRIDAVLEDCQLVCDGNVDGKTLARELNRVLSFKGKFDLVVKGRFNPVGNVVMNNMVRAFNVRGKSTLELKKATIKIGSNGPSKLASPDRFDEFFIVVDDKPRSAWSAVSDQIEMD